jgi:hypothetical protein
MRRLQTSHETLSTYSRRAPQELKQNLSGTDTLCEALYKLREIDLLVKSLNDSVLSYLIGMAILHGGELLAKKSVASGALATMGQPPTSARFTSPPSDALDQRAAGARAYVCSSSVVRH